MAYCYYAWFAENVKNYSNSYKTRMIYWKEGIKTNESIGIYLDDIGHSLGSVENKKVISKVEYRTEEQKKFNNS